MKLENRLEKVGLGLGLGRCVSNFSKLDGILVCENGILLVLIFTVVGISRCLILLTVLRGKSRRGRWSLLNTMVSAMTSLW